MAAALVEASGTLVEDMVNNSGHLTTYLCQFFLKSDGLNDEF